ncbi:MAG TPA: glycosyltransferase family 9 protein [Stellaceae bacterium]|jgi:hypothetical protein
MPDEWVGAMLDGAFERAWEISDRVLRERQGRSCADLPHHLRWVWDGTPLVGRRVLVRCYHGLGDTLQFIRFVPQVAAVARAVIVEAQPALLPLLRSVCPEAEYHPLDADLPAWEVAVESMELPHALRIAPAELPGRIPYLRPPAECMGRRQADRDGPGRRRVGLVWAAGNWRRERSIPAALLLPLARLPLDLVGLQQGPSREDRAAAGLVGALCGMVPASATIAETAALICQLDLVVTVDTMAAHLAGALGRPVWTLLDAEADWRWMRHRSDSPWYPTMRLFRQERPGLWGPVIERLTAALAHEAAGRNESGRRPVER